MTYEFGERARTTALRAARVMFPHDGLPDEAYEKVIAQLEREASGNPDVAATLEAGVAQLDDPTPFAELSADEQLATLTRHEDSEFFALLRSTAVVELYDNPLVWRAFGYEGASVHLGGYIDRGFDDLDWLPDPPIALDSTAGSHHR